MGMNIEDALSQAPQLIRELPIVQAMAQFIRIQAEQIQRQAEQIAKLEETVDALKDEISRLTNTPKRPKFRPGGMEPRNRKKNGNSSGNPSSKTNEPASKKVHVEIRVKADGVPEGARFKGYQDFSVQEVELTTKEMTYRLEVWQTQSGEVIRAQLPEELRGKHFGAVLRALILNLYTRGMTQPEILPFLQGIGVEISSGQISNILLDEAEGFSKASEEILSAGLTEAPYVRTDDTGEKHKHKNSYCTHIGGEYFAYYKTTSSKSRENFLGMLLQGKEGYCINDAMIWHLFQCGVKDDVLNLFEECKGKVYSSRKGLNRLLNVLGLRGKKQRSQCFEAALVGFISGIILKPGQVLLSDRAGQFAVFDHAACWVHMERPLRKIIPTCKQVEKELAQAREAIWTLYRKLKVSALERTGKEEIFELYDQLVAIKSISPSINNVIEGFRCYRDEMLKALDHPGLPLHNNDSERDIRGAVKRRKISGSTKSEAGRKFRDGLMSLRQTCFRLGLNFWEFSLQWFRGKPPDLAQLVRKRYRTATV